jgi:hypothetical protein
MKLFLTYAFAFIFLTSFTHSQTFNTNMENKSWTVCVNPNCAPGGNGIPTKVVDQFTGSNWPLDSLEIGLSGPPWTNLLVWQKVGATSASSFASEQDVYIPSATAQNAQALEFDIFAFNSPYEFMFGSQCVVGGDWWIWDQLHSQWIVTTRPCQLAAGWHHIQWFVHRVPGDTTCDGYPCEHHDLLGVDYIYTNFNLTEPAGPIPQGWGNDSGLNLQLDMSASGASLREFVKHINLYEW